VFKYSPLIQNFVFSAPDSYRDCKDVVRNSISWKNYRIKWRKIHFFP